MKLNSEKEQGNYTKMYYTKARLFPTLLTVIPLCFLIYRIGVWFFGANIEMMLRVIIWSGYFTVSAALLFLMVQINRLIAKEVFQRFYFQDEINMPTTNHLLWKDRFLNEQVKNKIRSKINEKFNLQLMSPSEEKNNEPEARKLIVSAVAAVRNSLRGNKLLLQHNIEYGFFRNLLGGCLPAILFSILTIVFGYTTSDHYAIIVGCLLALAYFCMILSGKFFMKRFGHYYSKILYEQFLTE